MSVLHVFDLDGTLLAGSTSAREISRGLGCPEAVAGLEAQRARGELTGPCFARAVHAVWSQAAPLTEDVLDRVLASAPWVAGMHRVCDDIRSRREHGLIVSTAPAFFVERLRDHLGLGHACGTPYPPLPFDGTPFDMTTALTPVDLVQHVKRVHQHLAGRDRELALVAYGCDGDSAPIFRALPGIPHVYGLAVSVAINAKFRGRHRYDLRRLADETYDSVAPDLWTVYTRACRRLRSPNLPYARGAAS